MIREKTGNLLHFSRKDRLGALIVLITVGGALAFTHLGNRNRALPVEEAHLLTEAENLSNSSYTRVSDKTPEQLQFELSEPDHYETFIFDPNTATAADWHRLGLSRKTTQTLLNYRSKGGKFYKPEDLQKIWGLDARFYNRVKDYIRIPPPAAPPIRKQFLVKKKSSENLVIAINSADSAEWMKLPGIGPVFSSRIVRFREKLGGFTAVEQVQETYGLPDSTFQKIKQYLRADEFEVKKLSINTATVEEFKNHPYINWNLANAIVAYRKQHGPYRSIADLKKIMLLDEETYNKILPYLTL